MAQMMLDRSSYHECTDLMGYRKEMGELVHNFRKEKLTLNKVHSKKKSLVSVLVHYTR